MYIMAIIHVILPHLASKGGLEGEQRALKVALIKILLSTITAMCRNIQNDHFRISVNMG